MKKILYGLITLGLVGAVGFGVTKAFFSDTEISKDNTFSAGKIDLKIDNDSYYNGNRCVVHENGSKTWEGTAAYPKPGTDCSTSWNPDDLANGHLFFDFQDVKPGDNGEDTISIRSDDNDAWACMKIGLTDDEDNTCTSPEKKDDPNCAEPGLQLGDLGGQLNFVFWVDDGDNVLEAGEKVITQGDTEHVFNNNAITLADNTGSGILSEDPLKGGQTYYVAKAWCFGTLMLDPVPAGQGENPSVNPGVKCIDADKINNAAQTDKVQVDFEFDAVQSRHNDGFTCNGVTPTPRPSVTTTVTPSPTPPLACNNADVMLVLDRSGSIDSTELGQLKTAANTFVTNLSLAVNGNHAGQSSFSTTGTLDQQLTSNPALLTTSINGLVSGGFTDLKDGIDLANTELASVRDRNDVTSPDKMIIITDGHPNRPLPSLTAATVAATSATNAKSAGIEIFVVGVGSDVDTTYLQNSIASPGDYYPVSNYSNLQTVLQNLNLCD